jgi:hypothetical protein
MLDVLTRCQPGREPALETLSGMVGAVLLARLCDDPQLAAEFLAATRKAASLATTAAG